MPSGQITPELEGQEKKDTAKTKKTPTPRKAINC